MKKLALGLLGSALVVAGCSSASNEEIVSSVSNDNSAQQESKGAALWRAFDDEGVSKYLCTFNETHKNNQFEDFRKDDNATCGPNALKMDDGTLYMDELETIFQEGELVDGVCGKALSLLSGEVAPLGVNLIDSMKTGTVEFWFRPGADFFDESARTLLGNDEARMHFFVQDGELVFQKNHADQHFFVRGKVEFKNDWNLIGGQWGDGYLSLWLNGELVARVEHNKGYVPSLRGVSYGNLVVIGYKSGCCMEGPGQYGAMTTSGDFDQFRISKVLRYDNGSEVSEEESAEMADSKWVVDWEFNDSDNVGKDFSGNGHDAVIDEGSVTIEKGNAVFDGKSGLTIKPTADMKLKNFVVEAKVFPKKIKGYNNILVTEPPGSGPDGWIFRFENGGLVFLVRDSEWNVDWKGIYYNNVETDKWYDIHVEYMNDTLRMFVNGELVGSKVLPGDFSGLKYPWGIGYDAVDQSIHNRYFEGLMDYVRVGTIDKAYGPVEDPVAEDTVAEDSTIEEPVVKDSVIEEPDTVVCSEPALMFDDQTLYLDEMDSVLSKGTLIEGVCGKAIRVASGEKAVTSISLEDSLEVGTVEFWFRPGADFYDATSRTILGNDEARVHFFVMDGELVFQKNHQDKHFFVKGNVEFKNDWNLIAGQWGDGFLSLWVNGELVARVTHEFGYAPSLRGYTDGNLIVAGYKSSCCMEGPGQYERMTTSGDFDQVRVSKSVRYDNASVEFEEVSSSSFEVEDMSSSSAEIDDFTAEDWNDVITSSASVVVDTL